MTDEAMQRLEDAEDHRKSYNAIMGAATEIGVPFCMALAAFFTFLVMGKGLLALLVAVAVYVFAHVIVKTFFAHH